MQEEIGDYINKSGHLNELAVSVYINALVQNNVESLNHEVLDHVEECSLCRSSISENYRMYKEVEEMELSRDTIQNSSQEQSPRRTLRYGIYYRIAAVAIILVSVGYLLFFALSDKNSQLKKQLSKSVHINNSKERQSVDKNDRKKPIDNKDIAAESEHVENREIQVEGTSPNINNFIAANFEESPSMENFISINVRSCEGIHIISPELSKDFNYGENIEFMWETEIKEPLILKIITNKEKIIFHEKKLSKVKYLFKEDLQPGLYYWKMETEEDLLFTGKFFVKNK